MTHRRRSPGPPAGADPALLERINPNTAGIDCGAEMHYVAVPPDRAASAVRAFKTFTAELHRLADWLTSCGVNSVAMESTGVYWIPLYEILESRGFAVVLVNARHVKNVPGRKSDVVDCQWLQQLHSVGLLRASFRPAAARAALRSYLRHRESLVQGAATHVQRMQKALVQMNLRLSVVLSDLTGATGQRIVRDIVAGQTDPWVLAQHRDARCRASEAELIAALTGHYRPEHLFVLQQNLELFDAHQRQIPHVILRSRCMWPPWSPRRPRRRARCPPRGPGRSPAPTSRGSSCAPRCTSSPAWISPRLTASAHTGLCGCSGRSVPT